MMVRGIGLMSGTSLDGIDAACIDLALDDGQLSISTREATMIPFGGALRDRLLKSLPPNEPSPREVAELDLALGEAFACAALRVCKGPVDFVGSHGLTLFHEGASHLTVQIANPYIIRDRLQATVVHDFRRADCALGGEGAPLVPYVDALLFGDQPLVALNIGGISNLSIIAGSGTDRAVSGWDTGPGNILIDAFVRMKTAGNEAFDRDGHYSAAGSVDETRLNRMLRDPYFRRVPPKSTGRELFGARFLAEHDLFSLSLEDGCATLTELSARSIAEAIASHAGAGSRVVISGGGTANPVLMKHLADDLPGYEILRSEVFGIDASFKEAIAFAVLGYETLRGRTGSLPAVTGADAAAVLGSIVPYGLAALLEKLAS
jgi:anhydro-N-acetylmuramic acid kinase